MKLTDLKILVDTLKMSFPKNIFRNIKRKNITGLSNDRKCVSYVHVNLGFKKMLFHFCFFRLINKL